MHGEDPKFTLSWFVFSREREAPTHVRPIDPSYINVEEVAEHAAFYLVNCLMNAAE